MYVIVPLHFSYTVHILQMLYCRNVLNLHRNNGEIIFTFNFGQFAIEAARYINIVKVLGQV